MMTSRTGNLRSDNSGHPRFIMADTVFEEEHDGERLAELLLLTWLQRADPQILGLRRVDEHKSGRALRMLHIAIPLDYSRKKLAQSLGLVELEDERMAPRVNVSSSVGCNKPHSYVRVHADFVVSRALDTIKKRIMRPRPTNHQSIQIPRGQLGSIHRSGVNQGDENSRLRASVAEALALKNFAVEPHQIQILTHRETGEKWIRILNVDRGSRTTLRLAIKRAGINASLAFDDDAEGSDWSIRFPAAEISKLFFRSSDTFDVQPEHRTVIRSPDRVSRYAPKPETSKLGRSGSFTILAESVPERTQRVARMVS
jgi:hypothetical protein